MFKAIEKEKLLRNAEEMGIYLESKLKGLKSKYSVVSEVRGIGLMLGLELTQSGTEIVNRAREYGLLINCTQDTVLRIMPPMTVSKTGSHIA